MLVTEMGKGAYGQVLGDDVLRSGHLQALGTRRTIVCATRVLVCGMGER